MRPRVLKCARRRRRWAGGALPCLCVCVFVYVCVYACMCACLCACGCACLCVAVFFMSVRPCVSALRVCE
jgi:hypothetical protein